MFLSPKELCFDQTLGKNSIYYGGRLNLSQSLDGQDLIYSYQIKVCVFSCDLDQACHTNRKKDSG